MFTAPGQADNLDRPGPFFNFSVAYHAIAIADFLLSGSNLCIGFVPSMADLRPV